MTLQHGEKKIAEKFLLHFSQNIPFSLGKEDVKIDRMLIA
jgi:hypothetical protein